MTVSTQPFTVGAAVCLIALALLMTTDGPRLVPTALLIAGAALVLSSVRRP